MDDEIGKNEPKVQADNQCIAIGEINITGTVTGNITIGHTIVQPVPTDARLRHELGILLKNVQTTWIQGVLEKSVHEAALLELGLELREEAVDNPWRMVIEGPDQTRETLPRGRRIKDIFDEANRLLLILGEPGSGKTTTLLQLARDLIAEVDLSTFTQPVPVILNLSTWTNKAQPLDEWLVAELNSKYRLPKKDGQRWLKERRILPLLDGLDEVRAENRAACVEKLNQLVTDYGLQGMVVCSRIKDYTDLNIRLAFYRAIYIQPLTPEQVDEYLNAAGDKLASLRATLQADEALRSMAQSPLILSVMSLAYQNTSAEDLSDPALNTNKARRKHLFDTYITRMFNRKAGKQVYDIEQTKQRLSWLAQNMQKHNQEIFLIESLQPSWLPVRGLLSLYILASRLSGILILWPLFRLISDPYESLPIALIAGLSIGLKDVLQFEWLRKRSEVRKPAVFLWSVTNVVVVGVTITLSSSLYVGLLKGLSFGIIWLILGSIFGLPAAMIFGIRGSRQSPENDIQTVEALRWSRQKALAGGLTGLLVGMLVSSFSTVIVTVTPTPATLEIGSSALVLLCLPYLVSFGLAGAILTGLRREILETKSSPNQGILLSIRNTIFGGLIFGLGVIGLISGLGALLVANAIRANTINYGLEFLLNTGLILGLMGALWYGGLDVIQHYLLRLILLIQGHTPANYARFLDYAVDRIFLQKVGGGYRFIHRLLLEHFAEMGKTKKE
jgi:hypothetical protein